MPKDVAFDVQLSAADGKPVSLPAGEKIANAEFLREGQDLVLQSPDGHAVKIAGYFDHTPDIVTSDGGHITSSIVNSFLSPAHPGEYAAADSKAANDATPVGKVTEVTGEATLTHGGEKIAIKVGTEIFQGDVISTSDKGALNILFADNTTFAISHNARLSIDQFVYNATDHEGSSFFSMLQGMFVYTSGLIGKEDPGHVGINTPVGSIGIRGTVVAGDIMPSGQDSHITIVDGAIVVTNGGGTLEMNSAFDTATLNSYGAAPADGGAVDTGAFTHTYGSLAPVSGQTFDNISNGTYAPAPDAHAPSDSTPVTPPADTHTTAPTDGTQMPMATPPASGSDFGSAAGSTFGSTDTGTTFNTGNTAAATATGGATNTGTVGALQPPSTGGTDTPVTTDPGIGTGTTTGGGTVGPTASMTFQFDGKYLSYTGTATSTNTDDGVNLTWDPGQTVGQVSTTNFPVGVTPVYHFQDGSNDIYTNTMQVFNTATPSTPYDTTTQAAPANYAMLHLDPDTGVLTVVDPFTTLAGTNNVTVVINAFDSVTGKSIAQAAGIIQFNSPGNVGDVLQVGDASGTSPNPPGTALGDFINGTSTNGNDILYGRDGSDQLLLDPTSGNDTALGGKGSDLIVLLGPSFHFIDGGQSAGDNDVLLVGSTATFSQNYDFTGATNVVNIEEIKLGNVSVNVGPTVSLNLADVFSMTDNQHNHTLTIINDTSTPFVSDLNLGLGGWTVNTATSTAGVTAGADILNNSGAVTINASFNSQTVTLVIQTTSIGGGGVDVHIH